jgi:Zn-dependent protease
MIATILENPAFFLLWFAAVAVALTVHEFSHAAMAVALGDETPRRAGRLTLNPLAHADILGTVMMLLAGFGWAKPVPFNPYNLKVQRWGSTLVALAGPFSNLAIVIVFGILNLLLVDSLGPANLLCVFLSFVVFASAGLMLFNVIPIPPLDGSKLLLGALSAPQYAQLRYNLETKGPFLLLLLILLDNIGGISIFGTIFGFPMAVIASVFRLVF